MKTKNSEKIIFLAPAIIGIFMFSILPIFIAIVISFCDWNLISDPEFIGLANYKELFTSPDFYATIARSFTFLIMYVVPVVFLGLLAAMLLNQNVRFRGFFRAGFFLPVISSWVAVSVIWMWMYNPDYGLINQFLSVFGITGPDWLNDETTAMLSVAITSVWKDIGFIAIILLAALQDIPGSYYEAADLDGANWWQKLWKITIPSITPQLFFVVIVSSITALQVFDQIMIMTGGGPGDSTTTAMISVYNNAFAYGNMGYACAFAVVLVLIIFAYSLVVNKIQKGVNQFEE